MKRMNRMPSRKSHSWWWTSHVSPKNSKWLAENLEKMDTQVKEMLKLIEEDCGDSFARKVEIYYQRRPMLITHVENFYRMYRALAERYDNVTGELRKNIPSSLQSQSSSDISESDTETRSPEPDLEQKEPQQGSSDTSESDSDLDDAKCENGDSISYALNQQNIELQDKLHETREKLGSLEEKNTHHQCDCGGNASILKSKLTELEEKLEASQSEISNLQKDLEEKTHSLESLKEVSSEKEALEAAVLASKNEIEGLKEAMSSAAQQHEVELVNRGLEVEKPLRGELQELSEANASLEDKLTSIEAQLKQVEADKAEASIESEKRLSELNQDTVNLKNKLEELSSDKAAVDSKVAGLLNDITTREEKMKQKDNHLHEMHLEHVKLIAETDVARKAVIELHKRVYELEAQVERQKVVILDSAERKREAIRQLCFSLEHYRDGYLQLRQQLQGHRRPLVVMAA